MSAEEVIGGCVSAIVAILLVFVVVPVLSVFGSGWIIQEYVSWFGSRFSLPEITFVQACSVAMLLHLRPLATSAMAVVKMLREGDDDDTGIWALLGMQILASLFVLAVLYVSGTVTVSVLTWIK